MSATNTFYPLLGTAKPSTAATVSASWSGGSDTTYTGTNAKALSVTSGASQTVANKDWGGMSKNTSAAFCSAAFTSPPLLAQSVSAGNYTVAFAGSGTSVSTWSGRAALFHVRAGSKITTIFDVTAIGSTGRAAGATELTCYSTTIAGSAFTLQLGDYLQLELGIFESQGTSNGLSNITNVYTSGTTAISSDAASTSDAQSALILPTNVTPVAQGTAALACVSTITPVSKVDHAAKGSLLGVAKVTAVALDWSFATAALTGVTTITPRATVRHNTPANLTSVATMTGRVTSNYLGVAALGCVSTVTASGSSSHINPIGVWDYLDYGL